MFRPTKPHTKTPSQAVFRVEAREKPETVWLTESPEPKLEGVVGLRWVSDIDKEFRQFFTKQSLQSNGLLHQEYRRVKNVIRVPRKEVGSVEAPDLQTRLLMPSNSELLIDEMKPSNPKTSLLLSIARNIEHDCEPLKSTLKLLGIGLDGREFQLVI